MALKAGYVGVKRRLYEKLQTIIAQNVKGISDLKEGQALLGAVNDLNFTAVTTTSNNVIFTVNADKSVSVETTAAGASTTTFFPLESYKARTGQKIYVKGCPAGGGMTNYCLQIRAQDQSSVGIEDGSGKWFEFDSDDSAHYALGIRINSGAKITTPIKFYPVLSLTDLDYPFAPYAMTNQELTKNVKVSDGLSSVTVAANATLSTGDSYLKRQGAFVNMMLRVNSVTVSGSGAIATIPEGYRPPVALPVFLTNASTGEYIPAFCTNSGLVCPRSAVTSLNVNIYATWYTSAATLNRSFDREALPEVIDDEPVETVKKATRTKKSATK